MAVSVHNRYGARFKMLTLVTIQRTVVISSSDNMVAKRTMNKDSIVRLESSHELRLV